MPASPANPEHDREGALLNDALDLPASDRSSFLDRACAGDPELCRRVQQLLEAHAGAAEFLEQGAAAGLGLPLDSTVPAPAPEEVPERIGRYRLVEKLGEGGFGSVYLAEQKEPFRRRVALKIIKLGMDSRQIVARFEAERQALAMMDHPNIAKVLDAGTTESGRPYFVMELIRGIKITEYCDQKRLPTRERLDLFIHVCHAVRHAHQKGIIHRDLKPSNILVTLHDGVPVPKVIDFGIAKATRQELTEKTLVTQFQQFLGTPAYMSPEQAEMSSLDVDTRSDIYSLGVLLYELLTGRTPFDAQELLAAGLEEMRRTIREKDPPKPSTRLQTLLAGELTTTAQRRQTDAPRLLHLLRGDLDWIVMKALEKDRTRRYETANGLARDIERHLNLEPVTARPPSALYRLQKLVHRNKLAVAAGSTIVLALCVALGLSTWSFLREQRAHENEASQRRRAEYNELLAQTNELRALQQQAVAEANALTSQRLLYDADINLAQRAHQSRHLGLARRLLARHVREGGLGKRSLPQPFNFGPEESPTPTGQDTNDFRDWEWRYLWAQCQSPAVRLCKLEAGISGLSFAPDGDRLAVTMLFGHKAELWSRLTVKQLAVLTTNGCGAAQTWDAAFSPAAPLLAIGLANGAVLVTNLDSGTHWTLQTGALMTDPNMMAHKLAFSPDGRRLAALGGHRWDASIQGSVFIWETEKFTLLSTNITSGPIKDDYNGAGLGWAPDSDRLWVGTADSWLEELPVGGGVAIRRIVAETGGLALAVSSSGDTLATAPTWDPLVKVWEIKAGKPLAAPRALSGHAAFVSCLAYSPDGRWLASASADQTIRLWDTTTWQNRELRGHTEEVHALAFTPDSKVLSSGSRDGEVLLWRLDTLKSWEEHLRLPETVASAVIAPGSRQLLAKIVKKALAVIDTRTLAVTPIPFACAASEIWHSGLAGIFDGTNRLTLIEVKDSGYRVLGETEGSANIFEQSCMLQDRLFAFVSGSNSVTCIPLDDFSRRFQLSAGPGVTRIEGLGSRGRQLFGYDQHENVLLWDLQERRLLRHIAIRGLRVMNQPEVPDLITLNLDRDPAIEFRDFANPEKVLSRLKMPYSFEGGNAFSPDHQLLAIAIQDTGSILLMDVPNRTLKRSLQRHLMAVRAPVFSPNGRRLASGGSFADNVKLWDVETGQELLSLSAETALNSFVQFSDDGNLILGGGWHLWRAPSWEEIAAAERDHGAGP